MNLKLRLTAQNFLQFYAWGAWLITIANYWFETKQWDATKFGVIFSTMGIASLVMPTLTGIIADKWVNAERLHGVLHLSYAGSLFYLTTVDDPNTFFWVMLVSMLFYMPTIALNNSISYSILKRNQFDIIKDFPPIRVWGTIGFIVAMWATNLLGFKATEGQFYNAGIAAAILGLYSFTMPACPPQHKIEEKSSFIHLFGLDAFKLFKDYKMALFFLFSVFLGGALQLTNAYGDVFLDEFKNFPRYADSVVVKYSTIIMSISQISETLFILAIPFFLKRFGIKNVMLISMLAWVLRFGLLGFGNPSDGLWMIILSCIVYGMAFDFFNVSGSLFVETNVASKIRASAQGIFMMMTNGIGAILGSLVSGWLIDRYFTLKFTTSTALANYMESSTDAPFFNNFLNNRNISIDASSNLSSPVFMKDWPQIWLTFAGYALVITILFAIFFKHKHQHKDIGQITH